MQQREYHAFLHGSATFLLGILLLSPPAQGSEALQPLPECADHCGGDHVLCGCDPVWSGREDRVQVYRECLLYGTY